MASMHSRLNKDGSTTFRVMYRIDGRQAQDSFESAVAAERYRQLVERVGGRTAREMLLSEESDPVEVPTLREWIARYLDPNSGLLEGAGPGTREEYAAMAERSFMERLGALPLTHLTDTDVRAWIAWQGQQKSARRPSEYIAAKTVKNYHALLSGALNAAVKEGLVRENVAHGAKLPFGRRAPIIFLSEREFARIYEHIPKYYQPIALALAGTGLRFGELSALTWGDLVRIDGGWCFDVTKAWKEGGNKRRILGPPKSEAGIRLVSVSDDIVAALGVPGDPHALIFKAVRGGAMTSGTFAKRGLHIGVARSGFHRRPRVHDLRHSHVSWLIARNVPLPYIQRRIGHEKIDTTIRVYGHLLPEALTSTRNAAGEALRIALAA